jgi:hypothetical protein
MQRGEYDTRGPAADGSFGERYPDLGGGQEERQERREERHERRDAVREDRREDWQEYGEDYYDDGYYGGYYEEEDTLVYWTLPCRANGIAMGGVIYYVCGSTWYTRVYSEGDVVYTVVPNPTGH